jgi:hypothetical protein
VPLRLAWSFVLANLSMKCHPATPADTVTAITVDYEIQPEGKLWLRYYVDCDLDNLVLPPPAEAQRTDGLWKTSCFELFLREPESSRYFEFNFSPSSQWAAYRFDDYREGMADWDTQTPEIGNDASDTHFALEATITLPPSGMGVWAASLSAVIHECGDVKSYWALNHTDGPPDFHHRDCFALKLAPPEAL